LYEIEEEAVPCKCNYIVGGMPTLDGKGNSRALAAEWVQN
jgi:hypothetical protein